LSATIELSTDFSDLLIALADHHVEFILIGGWAVALHGYGRGTDDIDIFVRPDPDNARRVVEALRDFGAPLQAHGITADLFKTPGLGYRMGVRPQLIELLTTIDGVTFDEANHGRRYFEIDSRQIPYIGRSALLKNKRAAGRMKDLADVEWLEKNPESTENEGSQG
jgi:hypothetical protein